MTTVIPEGLTFDEYHPSMAPIFEAIARRAVSDGRAYEYNDMASSLGFPNLDQLNVTTARTARYRVPVTVTLTVTREVYIDVDDVESDDNPDESDFIRDHYSEIESELTDLGDYDSIEEITAHNSDYIQFEEWVD
jgi:hypothetical protein